MNLREDKNVRIGRFQMVIGYLIDEYRESLLYFGLKFNEEPPPLKDFDKAYYEKRLELSKLDDTSENNEKLVETCKAYYNVLLDYRLKWQEWK
ncbi:MAG: hypothetical protein GY739_21775 [Mesoflavibacter sp.]|nr:hypothetical protein [Mesoflavibacter sp.]